MDEIDDIINERIRSLADALDCLTEDDLLVLAGITHGTAAAWRKRGNGPPYLLFGNRYLYPRKQLQDFLQTIVREPRATVPAAELL